MKEFKSLKEATRELFEESFNRVFGWHDSLQFLRDQYQYDLEIRNEEFFKKFSQILKTNSQKMKEFRQQKQTLEEKLVQLSKERDGKLRKMSQKHDVLSGEYKDIENQLVRCRLNKDSLEVEIDRLKKKQSEIIRDYQLLQQKYNSSLKTIDELKRSSPIRDGHKSPSSPSEKNKKNTKHEDHEFEQHETNKKTTFSFSSSFDLGNMNNINGYVNDSEVSGEMFTESLIDELLLVENQYFKDDSSEQMKHLSEEEKKLVWKKIRLLVERNVDRGNYEKQLEFIKRKKAQSLSQLEDLKREQEMKNDGREGGRSNNRIRYVEKQLQHLEKLLLKLTQEKELKERRKCELLRRTEELLLYHSGSRLNPIGLSLSPSSSSLRNKMMKRSQQKRRKTKVKNVKEPPLLFVFTDIQNSTGLWEQNTEMMISALQTHNKLLKKFMKELKGEEVKSEGDSFFVVFKSIRNGIDFCLKSQLALLTANWPDGLDQYDDCATVLSKEGFSIFKGFRVRMGMDYGRPDHVRRPDMNEKRRRRRRSSRRIGGGKKSLTTNNEFLDDDDEEEEEEENRRRRSSGVKRVDYFGSHVNRASRVQSLGKGGEILMSSSVFEMIQKGKMENQFFVPVTIQSMGEKKLKGFEKSEKIYSIFPEYLRERIPILHPNLLHKKSSSHQQKRKRINSQQETTTSKGEDEIKKENKRKSIKRIQLLAGTKGSNSSLYSSSSSGSISDPSSPSISMKIQKRKANKKSNKQKKNNKKNSFSSSLTKNSSKTKQQKRRKKEPNTTKSKFSSFNVAAPSKNLTSNTKEEMNLIDLIKTLEQKKQNESNNKKRRKSNH